MPFDPVWLFVGWLALISLISIIVTVADKSAARRGRRRVPERTLLLLSALGGAVAMYITMHLIRHKTRKAKFMVGIPAIWAAELAVIAAVWWFCYR